MGAPLTDASHSYRQGWLHAVETTMAAQQVHASPKAAAKRLSPQAPLAFSRAALPPKAESAAVQP